MGKADRLFIVNLPDNINGAFIYRNGIRDAIRLFSNADRFKDVVVISYNNIYEKDDGIMVTRISDVYSVQLLNQKAYFMNVSIPIESTFVTEYFEILNFKNNGYELKFKEFNTNDKLSFYSAGKMVPCES